MKKFILWVIGLAFLFVISILGLIFYRPALVINPKVLSFVLHKTDVLKAWHWDKAVFVHERKSWNHRNFSGAFDNFCLTYDSAALGLDTCFEKISWNVDLTFSMGNGLQVKTISPFIVRSPFTDVVQKPAKEEEKPSTPPDIYGSWKLFWSDLSPDMDMKFDSISVKNKTFDLSMVKTEKTFYASALKFELRADPKGFILQAPKKYPLPKKLPLAVDPVHFIGVEIHGDVKEEGIHLTLLGKLESIDFNFKSTLALPLKGGFDSLEVRRDFVLRTTGRITLPNIKGNLKKYGPAPYTELPAPLNVMDGFITTDVSTKEADVRGKVEIQALTNFSLKSDKQSLVFTVNTQTPFSLMDYKVSGAKIGLEFQEVLIQLPRFSKKSPPPQFIPDGRFKKEVKLDKGDTKKKLPVDVSLTAEEESPLQIRTDLLDELLRLSFDIQVGNGKVQDGHLKILPLKTSVFKRPIKLKTFLLNFLPDSSPVLSAQLEFPLPEYKITLDLEGPVAKPRYAFKSDPPLPQNDIYAVLLFGRPLADLDPDDKTAATKTNQLLSQGILSLSVLYFLAGSPVEYVGYDPGSKNATAQFGLGKKSSLRIGGGQEGVNSTAIRRSLGKGWYLDTSVQNSSNQNSATQSQSKNYGVLLERIISY